MFILRLSGDFKYCNMETPGKFWRPDAFLTCIDWKAPEGVAREWISPFRSRAYTGGGECGSLSFKWLKSVFKCINSIQNNCCFGGYTVCIVGYSIQAVRNSVNRIFARLLLML